MEKNFFKSAMFNPVKLIEEVKNRPALYLPDKCDRDEKLALWREVGAAIFADWDQCNKATWYDRVLQLQRKWRSLRDAYNRELRSRRSGVRVNQRVYVYFKRMSFLGGFDGNISDEIEIEDHTSPDPPADQSFDDEPTEHIEHPPVVKKAKKRKVKKTKSKRTATWSAPEEVEVSFADMTDDSDSDKLFLLSFLPEMRDLPLNIKMWTRAQISSVMQEAVSRHYNTSMPGSSSSVSRNNSDIKTQRRDSSD